MGRLIKAAAGLTAFTALTLSPESLAAQDMPEQPEISATAYAVSECDAVTGRAIGTLTLINQAALDSGHNLDAIAGSVAFVEPITFEEIVPGQMTDVTVDLGPTPYAGAPGEVLISNSDTTQFGDEQLILDFAFGGLDACEPQGPVEIGGGVQYLPPAAEAATVVPNYTG